MNNFEKFLMNRLQEGETTGGSPTKTGIRVGKFTKNNTYDKRQVDRIQHKTAKRQENLWAAERSGGHGAGHHGLTKDQEDARETKGDAYRAPEVGPRRSKKAKENSDADRGNTYAQAATRFRNSRRQSQRQDNNTNQRMNNFEKFLIEKLIEAHSPDRHRVEVRDTEFHKSMGKVEKGRQDFEKSGGPKSAAHAQNPDPKKEDEFHHNIIDKGDKAAGLRAKRLKKQFGLKKQLKKGELTKEKLGRMSKQNRATSNREKSGARGRGGKDESEYAQDNLGRAW